jgi:hypothetical protein
MPPPQDFFAFTVPVKVTVSGDEPFCTDAVSVSTALVPVVVATATANFPVPMSTFLVLYACTR